MGRFDHKQYVELTMHFRCNLKCEHCMIEGTMDWLEPETFTRLKQVIAHNLEERCWKGLILTGAEITLRRDLPELARLAPATASTTFASRPMACASRTSRTARN